MISKFYTRDYEGEMLSENISWKQGKKSNNQMNLRKISLYILCLIVSIINPLLYNIKYKQMSKS